MSIRKISSKEGVCGICSEFKELVATDSELPSDAQLVCEECEPCVRISDKALNDPYVKLARPKQ
jgi:hypothetical protein